MQAIVIARSDRREHDQLVTFLTREKGRIDCMARGLKKSVSKNSTTLQVGAFVEIEITQGKQFSYVIQAQPILSFSHIRTTLQKTTIAQHAISLVYKQLQPHEPDSGVFDLLISFLTFLEEEKQDLSIMGVAFTLKLFSTLGFYPGVDVCVISGDEDVTAFSVEDGGVVNKQYQRKAQQEGKQVFSLTDKQLELLRTLLSASWVEVAAIQVSDTEYTVIRDVIYAFVQYQTSTRVASSYEIVRSSTR